MTLVPPMGSPRYPACFVERASATAPAAAGRGIGRSVLGIGLAVGAIAGVAALLYVTRPDPQFMVSLDTTPDFSPIKGMPEGPARLAAAYRIVMDHWNANSGPAAAALDAMRGAAIVKQVDPSPVANSFIVTVDKRHVDEFETQIAGVDHVGTVERAAL